MSMSLSVIDPTAVRFTIIVMMIVVLPFMAAYISIFRGAVDDHFKWAAILAVAITLALYAVISWPRLNVFEMALIAGTGIAAWAVKFLRTGQRRRRRDDE